MMDDEELLELVELETREMSRAQAKELGKGSGAQAGAFHRGKTRKTRAWLRRGQRGLL